MATSTNKLSLVRGNTLIINYVNQDNATPPNPISLNGATCYFTVKKTPGYDSIPNDSSALWQVISTGNTGNTCTFTSTAIQTWVDPGTYYWDITLKYLDGTVITPVYGQITIIGVPTNSAS